MKFRITACCIAAALSYHYSCAQTRVPVGGIPTFYNGGFAGEAGRWRLSAHSFLEFDRIYTRSGSGYRDRDLYTTGTYLAADQFLKKLRSGVAITVGQQGDDYRYRFTTASLAISPKFSHQGKYTFAPFATFHYHRWHWLQDAFQNPAHLTFGVGSSQVGFLLNSQRAYIGATFGVLQLHESGGTTFFYNMTHYLQAGYSFQRTPDSKFSFTPQLLVAFTRNKFTTGPAGGTMRVNHLRLADLNLVCRYQKFIGGINVRGVMLGYQNDRFKLQVTNLYRGDDSFRESIELGERSYLHSDLFSVDGYSGNVSLRYLIGNNRRGTSNGF